MAGAGAGAGADWIGRTQIEQDRILARDVRALAATLDRGDVDAEEGLPLPPLWHWMLFAPWQPTATLGIDGHPRRGGFLPPFHALRRRMWASGEVTWHAPLRIGDAVQRTSRIAAVEEKTGASGALAFVTVAHELHGPDGLALSELQHIVYRDGVAVTPGARAARPLDAAQDADAVSSSVACDTVLLFRYSALTGNSHRVHYDQDYARFEEGYPGLLVHLPLQATLLAGLLKRFVPVPSIRRFSFRGRRPAFAARTLNLHAWHAGARFEMESSDPEGQVCVTAEAH